MNNHTNINVNLIIPNKNQPRIKFEDDSLRELSNSIKEHGIIQPLILRRHNDNYEIIAGERRYRAAVMAGLNEVPAVIREMDDKTSAEVAIVENIQRKDLTSIEEARSYKKILDQGHLTQEELANKMGLTQSSISNKLRLLNLDKEVQDALLYNKISERHARSLLKVEDKKQQISLLNQTINERLTVRKLDELINNTFDSIESLDLDETDNKEPNTEILDNNNENTQIDTLEEIKQIPKPTRNIFAKETFPSLEKEKVNLGENIFDVVKEDKIEEQPEVNEVKEKIIYKEKEIILNKDEISTFTKELDNLEKIAKASGFDIVVEHFDFTDLYQIIIKINK